jgi:hypothetical protein
MTTYRASLSNRRTYRRYLAAWKAAGCPRHFRWRCSKSGKGERIWDNEARKERLRDLDYKRVDGRGYEKLVDLRYKRKTLGLNL